MKALSTGWKFNQTSAPRRSGKSAAVTVDRLQERHAKRQSSRQDKTEQQSRAVFKCYLWYIIEHAALQRIAELSSPVSAQSSHSVTILNIKNSLTPLWFVKRCSGWVCVCVRECVRAALNGAAVLRKVVCIHYDSFWKPVNFKNQSLWNYHQTTHRVQWLSTRSCTHCALKEARFYHPLGFILNQTACETLQVCSAATTWNPTCHFQSSQLNHLDGWIRLVSLDSSRSGRQMAAEQHTQQAYSCIANLISQFHQ